MSDPELSVILPMFNEEEVISQTLSEVKAQVAQTGLRYEILCINDGSRDGTETALDRYAAEDSTIVPFHFSRNFGKEAAMAAGLEHASGRAVLLLDADLQHPPELIPQMVAKWQQGADVVNGVKASRGDEGAPYRAMAWLFNKLMGESLGPQAAERGFQGASDFKLLDRQVIDAVQACPERHRFFRGLVAWVGFRVVDLPFEVQERAAGETKWSLRSLIRYTLQNLVAFTAAPLRFIAVAGFSMLTFTVLLGLWQMARYLRGDSLEGFPTVILLQLIFGSILLTSLGVISIYLAEMFDELKRRPVYLYRVRDPARDGSQSSPPPGRARKSTYGVGTDLTVLGSVPASPSSAAPESETASQAATAELPAQALPPGFPQSLSRTTSGGTDATVMAAPIGMSTAATAPPKKPDSLPQEPGTSAPPTAPSALGKVAPTAPSAPPSPPSRRPSSEKKS